MQIKDNRRIEVKKNKTDAEQPKRWHRWININDLLCW